MNVHAFRTVVNDSGATLGFIISERGFQAGAYEAAAHSNVRLVTWRQFQIEMYERWFNALETRLAILSDQIYDLGHTGTEPGAHPTLASEAVNEGGEQAWNELEQLQKRYVQFAFASTHIGFGAFRRFPFTGIDPRAAKQKKIVFKSARIYFDIMLEAAPRAFADYAAFLLKYTGGRCGSHQVLDESIIDKVIEGKNTMSDVRPILGYGGWVERRPYQGEVWTFRGSITQFDVPLDSREMGSARTSGRILTLDFGPNEILRHIAIEEFEHDGPPRS